MEGRGAKLAMAAVSLTETSAPRRAIAEREMLLNWTAVTPN